MLANLHIQGSCRKPFILLKVIWWLFDSSPGRHPPHPKPRLRRLQPSADPRRDLDRQPRRFAGFDRDAAERHGAGRRLESSR
jgi:hypothetical protein